VSGWLNGRVAVVTGANRGIGAATALAIAARGAHVVAAARNPENLDGLVARIRASGQRADPVPLDLSEGGAASRLFAAVDAIGSVDALVCCAATFRRASVEETDPTTWRAVLGLNLDAVWECSREAFVRMQASGSGGRILNISSLSGVYATQKFPGLAAYNTSKYGVIGLTEALAVEGREAGIGAVCVSPGAVATDMLRAAHPDMAASLTPSDVGTFIGECLDSSGFLTMSGANIPLFSNA